MLHNHLSSGVGTIGQTVADVPSGLLLTHPKKLHQVTVCTLSNIIFVGLDKKITPKALNKQSDV
jgi:hypothetical protein